MIDPHPLDSLIAHHARVIDELEQRVARLEKELERLTRGAGDQQREHRAGDQARDR